jgi:Starch-binding associating with outer membrane/Susd and RagB outer membrane lipoprotein
MKFFKYIPKSAVALAVVLTASSCSLFDLDVNQDPNNPATAAPELLLARIETDIAGELGGLTTSTETFMGLIGTQNTSRFSLQNTSFDGDWQTMYLGPLKDVEGLIATTQGSPRYLGIAQLLKAYMYVTMVDCFGDVPFTEACKADAATPIKAPKFDKDADIYAACLKLADEGLANLAKATAITVSGDIIYGGSAANWTAFGKTLKLKMLMTGRKGIAGSDKLIDALIKAGGFITQAQDFQFQFSKDASSIRHPWYTGAYTGGEFDGSYICNQLMAEMYYDNDPRMPFYFRRQTVKTFNINNPADRQTVPSGYLYGDAAFWKKCFDDRGKKATKADSTYISGLFGRERADPTGVPADGSFRTLPGVYPCGGYYDGAAPAIPASDKAPGGGIHPMLTSVNVLYYQIENLLQVNQVATSAADARKLFEQAMRDHITKVVNFSVATDPTSVRPAAAAIDAFVNTNLAKYDAAPNNDAKLDVCMKQLWYASFGSGMESWCTFRRTGMPTTLTDPNAISKTSRNFPNRLPYAQTELTNNPNASAYKGSAFDKDKLFWQK